MIFPMSLEDGLRCWLVEIFNIKRYNNCGSDGIINITKLYSPLIQ